LWLEASAIALVNKSSEACPLPFWACVHKIRRLTTAVPVHTMFQKVGING
jgi:hypothetical protein